MQRGRLFECNNTMSARLDDNTLRYNLTQNYNFSNGTTNATLIRTLQQTPLFSNNDDKFLEWNHFAFSFRDRRMRIHINGVQANETTLIYVVTNTTRNCEVCTIGNSLDYKDPLNGFIRHLTFLNTGIFSNTSIALKMRQKYLPYDATVLSYFAFSQYSIFNETYSYNSNRQIESQNVSLNFENEPEQVCYHTSPVNNYLKLNNQSQLAPFNISTNNTNLTLNETGYVFQIWIFPLKNTMNTNESAILRITNYTDVLLVNNGSFIKVNLYGNISGLVDQSIIFNNSRGLAYHAWTQLTVHVSNNQSVLYFNDQEIERRNHSVILPSLSNINISSDLGESLHTLVYRVSLARNPINQSANITSDIRSIYSNHLLYQNLSNDYQYLFNIQSTLDQLENATNINDQEFNGTFLLQNMTMNVSTESNETYQLEASLTNRNISRGFIFEQNNLLLVGQNVTTLSTLWDSQNKICKNKRLSALFYVNYTIVQNRTLSAFLMQPSPQLTIDLWFKFFPSRDINASIPIHNSSNLLNNESVSNGTIENNTEDNSQNQTQHDHLIIPFEERLALYGMNRTILINYEQDSNFGPLSLLKIYINNFNGSYKVICDPFSRERSTQRSSMISNQEIIKEGVWMHFTCVIDNSQSSQLISQTMLYNMGSQLEQRNNTINSKFQLQNNSQPLETFIGSDQNGYQIFVGMIKEIRIFNTALSLDVIKLIRNQQVPDTLKNILLYRFSFSNGISTIVDLPTKNSSVKFLTSKQTISNFVWETENQLVICNKYQLFNGQCCNTQNLTANITYYETQTYLYINSTLSREVILDDMSNFTWKLISVIPNNTAYFNYLNQSLLNQNTSRSLFFNRSSLFRNSSFTLQLNFTSIYSQKVITQNKEVIIACPLISLNQQSQTLYHPWGYTPKLFLVANVLTDCYNKNVTARNITWTYNFTLGDPTTISTNRLNLTFSNETRILNDTNYQINLSVNFTNNQVINETRIIRYLSKPIIFDLAIESYYLRNNDTLIINANSTQYLVNTVNNSELGLNVNCITPLSFTNQSTSLGCKFNQTGYFNLNNSLLTSTSQIIPYLDYFFNLSAGKLNTTLQVRKTVKARWFNEGILGVNCPQIQVPTQINISKSDIARFLYCPTFILDCLSSDNQTYKRYDRTNISYSIDTNMTSKYQQMYNQSLPFKLFNESFILQNDSYAFRFTANSTLIQKIQAGNIIPINITINMTDPITKLQITDTKIVNINVIFSDIQINQNQSTNSTGYIQFDQDLILNASTSYDPDMNISTTQSNNSMLVYSYLCNGKPCLLNSTQMSGGVIKMTIVEALNMNFTYLTPQNFSIGVQNPLISRKQIQYANFTVFFMPPVKNGTHACPRVFYVKQNSSNSTQASTKQSIFAFNTVNASNGEWKVSYENCDNFTTYSVQYMIIDVPNIDLLNNQTTQIFSKTFNTTVISTSRDRLLTNIGILQNNSVRATLVFNYTNTLKQPKVGYSVQDLTFSRQYSSLVPLSRPNDTINGTVRVGYEETLQINSDDSYDPDLMYLPDQKSKFTYIRLCSSNIQSLCPFFQGVANYQITKSQRQQVNQHIVGSIFWISLQLVDVNRTSLIQNLTYEVVTQDYQRCVKISDSNQNIIIQSEKLRMPIILAPKFEIICDYVQLSDSAVWESSLSQFWNYNSLYNYQVVIYTEQLQQLPLNQDITLKVKAQYTIDDNTNQNLLSLPFNYTLRILQSPHSVLVQTKEPIDITSETSMVNIHLINQQTQVPQTNNILCNVSCLVNQDLFSNFTMTESCSFDFLQSLGLYIQPTEIPSIKSIALYITLTTLDNGQTYNKTKTIAFSTTPQAPNCTIKQTSNNFLQLDKTILLSAETSNYNVSQLDYYWGTFESDRALIPINNVYQRLKIPEYSFYYKQGQEVMIEVIVNTDDQASNDCRTSMIMTLPSNNNIVLGTYSFLTDKQNYRSSIVTVELAGYSDNTNAGNLLFSIKYTLKNFNYTLLTKSLTQKYQTILPECDALYLEIYDQNGSLKIQLLDILTFSLNNNLSMTEYAILYNKIVEIIDVQEKSYSGQLNKNLELSINMLLQASHIIAKNESRLTDEMIDYYTKDIIQRTQTMVLLSKQYLGFLDAKVNCQLMGIQILSSLYNKTYSALIYDTLQTIVDSSYLQIDSEMARALYSFYSSLGNRLIREGDLTGNQISSLSMIFQSSISSQKSQLSSGDVLKLPIYNVTIQKVSLDDIPLTGITSRNEDVEFTLTPDALNNLNLTEIYLSMRIEDGNIIYQTNANQSNLTRVGSVININFTDIQSNYIPFQDRSAVIGFANVDTQTYQNIKCGYFDTTRQLWLIDSEAGMTTQVVDSSNQVFCQTSHLSVFSIFNITEDSKETIPDNPGTKVNSSEEGNSSSTRRIIISIIQIVLILVAVNCFIISARFESQRSVIFKEHNFSKIQAKLSFTYIFKNFAKVMQIFFSDQANGCLRVLFISNYFLFVMFILLVNLSVLGNDRSTGDEVFLIGTILIALTLLSPYGKEITTFKFYEFIPIGQFSDILKESKGLKQSQLKQKDQDPFSNVIKESEKVANPLKKSQLTQQYQSQQLHTSTNLILVKADKSAIENINGSADSQNLEAFQNDLTVLEREQLKDIKYRTQKFEAHLFDSSEQNLKIQDGMDFEIDTDLEAARRTRLNANASNTPKSMMSSAKDQYQANSSQDDGDRPGVFTARNLNQLSMNIHVHSMSKKKEQNSQDQYEEDDEETNNNIQQQIIQDGISLNDHNQFQIDDDNEDFQFEGGSDDENMGPSHTGQRMTNSQLNKGAGGRRARYEVNENEEVDPSSIVQSNAQNKQAAPKEYEEKVLIKSNSIAVIHSVILAVLLGVNLFLFYYCNIQLISIHRPFIADLIISQVIQFLLIDLALAYFAYSKINQHGLGNLSTYQGVFVFGVLNVNRIRAL